MVGITINTKQEWTEIIANSLGSSSVLGVETGQNTITMYFENLVNAKGELKSLDDFFPGCVLSSQIFIVEKKNWNEIWESNFKPVEIEDFCRIRAPFHSSSDKFRFEMMINPEMAFGTGHHATTSMMIKSMRHLDFNGKMVFDFGCGTGILSILASYLGALKVIGNDVEMEAVESSIKNARLNKVDNIEIIHGSLNKVRDFKPEILLANINRNVLLNSMDQLFDMLGKGGEILLSGILKEDEDQILKTYSSKFHFIHSIEEDGWLCFLFQKDFKAS